RNYIKKATYLFVLLAFSSVFASSYDDYFRAVKQDRGDLILALLQRGFDPNALDPAGEHGLYIALREPSPRAAQTLIDWPQTNLEWRNEHDENALMMAALKGHLQLVQRLLARGAQVNKP